MVNLLRPSGRALLSQVPRSGASVGAADDATSYAAIAIVGVSALAYAGFTLYHRGVAQGCEQCRAQDRQWIREGKASYLGA